MSRFSRVAWKEGQLLLPQHLQQMERSMEAAFLGRWAPNAALAWGVSTLQVDEAALVQGRLALVRGQGILPDGTVFDFPTVDPTPPDRTVQLRADTETLEVFLALPALRAGISTTTADRRRTDLRFLEVSLQVPDDLEPNREETIEVAAKNLRIVLGGEPLAGMVTLKLGELRRSKEGALVMRQDCVPPCLRLSGAPALLKRCQDVLALMAARAQSLTAERRQRYGRQSVELSQADVLSFWYLHTLNLTINRLRHLIELRTTHPAEVYGELVAVVGSLGTFSADGVEAPPLYRHEAPGECFFPVADQIEALLKLIFASAYETIALTSEAGFWVGHIGSRELLDRGTFYLVVTPTGEVPPGEIARLPSLFKMSVPDAINALVAGGKDAGVGLQAVRRTPDGLPASADATVFQVSREGEHWRRIQRDGQVAMWVPGWLPLRLDLVAQRPREAR